MLLPTFNLPYERKVGAPDLCNMTKGRHLYYLPNVCNFTLFSFLLIFIIFFKTALILCSYWFCWLWACNRSYGRLTIRSLVLSWEDWQLTDLVPGRSVGACLIQMLNLNNLGQLIRPKLIIIVQFKQFNVILWFVSFHILLLNVNREYTFPFHQNVSLQP